MSLTIREVLKNLCCNNGWCYGLFWGVNQQNSMLLTIEDAYYEENVGNIINDMLQQVHILGEGIIGEVAFTGKHQWMFYDTSYQLWGPTGSVNNQDVFQDISEFHRHFSSGIKTIALITVAPLGVMQFGSNEKIPERLDFVDHIRYVFQHLASFDRQLSRYALTALNREVYDQSSTVASAFSSGSSCPNYVTNNTLQLDGGKGLMGNIQSPMVVPLSSLFNSGLQNDNVTPLMSSSSHLQNQFQTASADAKLIPSTHNMQSPQVLSQFTSNSAFTSATRNQSRNSEEPCWTMFDQHMLSGMGMEESPNTITSISHTPLSGGNINDFQNFQGDTSLSSTYGLTGLHNLVDNTVLPVGYSSSRVLDDQVSAPLLPAPEIELPKGSSAFQMFALEDSPSSDAIVSHINTENNLPQLIAESVEQGNLVASSSGLVGHETLESNSVDNVNAVQNSLDSIINPLRDVYDEKANFTMQLPADSDLFDSLGMDFEHSQRMDCWDDYIVPVVSGSHSSLSTGASECISDFDVGSTAVLQQRFYTDLRLEQLLEGVISDPSDTRPSLEDQLFTTTSRTTGTLVIAGSVAMQNNQVSLANRSYLGGNETKDDSLLPECRVDKCNMQKMQKETRLKAQVGSWIDDSYSINTESGSSTHPKKSEETTKGSRRKGQSRESSRPRPKDRQQIQDRVKELREIVPNCAKCSIDALLDRTIKHMLFLQSVTKYGDKLKQVDEPKIIDENGVVLKDNSTGGGGATWVYEVGGQTMLCPIIVEELSPPGQMLIEMLCEDRGYFLEVADTIRGFGLTILKGVMEIRDDKIWARFIVEANRDITRMDIFLSLVQLSQQTATSGISTKNQRSDGGVPMFTNYHHSPIALPVGLAAEPLR